MIQKGSQKWRTFGPPFGSLLGSPFGSLLGHHVARSGARHWPCFYRKGGQRRARLRATVGAIRLGIPSRIAPAVARSGPKLRSPICSKAGLEK